MRITFALLISSPLLIGMNDKSVETAENILSPRNRLGALRARSRSLDMQEREAEGNVRSVLALAVQIQETLSMVKEESDDEIEKEVASTALTGSKSTPVTPRQEEIARLSPRISKALQLHRRRSASEPVARGRSLSVSERIPKPAMD